MYHIINNQYVRRAFKFYDEIYLIEIQHTASCLRTILLNEVCSLKPVREIIVCIEEWFDINRDLVPFYEIAHSDDILVPLANQFYGLRKDMLKKYEYTVLAEKNMVQYRGLGP